jgi:hypothetical protein
MYGGCGSESSLGLLEPVAWTMPSTGLCRVDVAECMFGLVEAVDVLAGSAYS